MALEADRPIGAVLKDIVGNVQQIIRAEVRLARAETIEELAKTRRGFIFLTAGAAVLLVGFAFGLLACMYLLATKIALWQAAAIVAIVAAIVGALGVSSGADLLRSVKLVPPRTAATIEENLQWTKTPAK
jgi:uncharacterized membrane protein YqjE